MTAARPAPPQHGYLRPVVAVAGLYAVGVLVWLVLGSAQPGGRWLPVHLFTLGILSNLVVALTHHFAQTLLHTPGGGPRTARLVLLNVGVLLMLGVWSLRWALAAGATLVVAAVAWLYVDLRRMRRASLTGRFAFVVRAYERACGAFFHGATLGVLMGVGLLGGAWYGSARIAHLHVNILGWGGTTLLATVVFFGPTIMRTKMEPGADKTAALALRHGMTALTVGALALLLTGAGGAWALPMRLLGAAGLAGFAVAATAVCVPVIKAGARAKRSAQAWMIRAACVWFVIVVWADAAVVAAGHWRLLDALGALLVVAVLGQAIIASLGYLAPMLAPGGPAARTQVRERLEVAARTRPVVLNAGALAVGAAAVAGRGADLAGAVLARAGWAAIGLVVLAQLGLIASGVLGVSRGRDAAARRG